MTREKIKQLNCQLLVWAYEYYSNDQPSVSDAEYDGLYNTYLEALKTTDYRPFCSVDRLVGSPTSRAYEFALKAIQGSPRQRKRNNGNIH